MDRTEHRTVFVVAATPPVPGDVLMASVFGGAAAVFGVHAIDDIATGPGGTVLLAVTQTPQRTSARNAVLVWRVLGRGIAAHTCARGFPDVSVEVEGLGTLLSSGPFREVTEHWVDHLGSATTVTAPRHSYATRIADLISRQAIRTLFQPIVDAVSGDVIGYEALSRGPRGDELEGAWQLLDAARRGGFEDEASMTMAHLARIRAAFLFNRPNLLLFVNAQPTSLWWPLDEDLEASGGDAFVWPAKRTVVELTERTPIHDVAAFLSQRDAARDQGVRFALDDAGAGYAGLGTLALLAPDFVKVDMSLVRGCEKDALKRSVIEALVYLSDRTGSTVIAEGVETKCELAELRSLGVQLVQGFLIAEPAEMPPLAERSPQTEIIGHRDWAIQRLLHTDGVEAS